MNLFFFLWIGLFSPAFPTLTPPPLLVQSGSTPPKFDPQNPLPGKKKTKNTGPRAIWPGLLSAALGVGGTWLAYEIIVEDSVLGEGLPKGSLLVATIASIAPSTGRLIVPEDHAARNSIYFSLGRMSFYALFFSSNLGVSRGGRGISQVGFVGLSLVDIATTFALRFPEKKPISLLPTFFSGGGLGISIGGPLPSRLFH